MARMKRDEFLGDYNLRLTAGKPMFKRAVAYVKDGRVRITGVSPDGVVARVQGTERYRVELSWRAGRMAFSCDCYMGEHGFFCKHCVAAAIVWRDRDPADDAPYADLREYLQSLPATRLADLLIERAGQDEDFERRLRLTAATSGDTPDLAYLRRAIKDAMDLAQQVHWRELYQVTDEMREVADALTSLLETGRAAEVCGLCEFAVSQVHRTVENCDDTNSEIANACARYYTLHLEACNKLKIGRKQLARLVMDWITADDYGLFGDMDERYFDLLGADARDELKRLVDEAWANDDAPRSVLGDLRLRFARERGDIDAEVEILADDLSHPWAFLEIARVLTRAERKKEAVQWLERGLKEHPGDFLLEQAAAAKPTHARAVTPTPCGLYGRPTKQHHESPRSIALWNMPPQRANPNAGRQGRRAAAKAHGPYPGERAGGLGGHGSADPVDGDLSGREEHRNGDCRGRDGTRQRAGAGTAR